MSNPPITALIVTYHTGPSLKDCLGALQANPDIAAIIIVDNGNPPEETAWLDNLAQDEAGVTLIRPDSNLGFGKAINLGAQQAKPGHLLILNPDAILDPAAPQYLQETGARLTPPWIVGGQIQDAHGKESRGARRRDLTLGRAVLSFLGVNTWTLEQTPAPDGPVPMPVISGAFFLTSTNSFAELGGFDEAFFLHVEDVDLCKRCRDAGGHVLYDPRAVALHYGATSDVPSRVVEGHKADSLALYFDRHAKGPIERLAAKAMMPLVKWVMLARAR